MKVHMKLKGEDGTPMNYSIYNTINKVPGKSPKSTDSVAKSPTTSAAAHE